MIMLRTKRLAQGKELETVIASLNIVRSAEQVTMFYRRIFGVDLTTKAKLKKQCRGKWVQPQAG